MASPNDLTPELFKSVTRIALSRLKPRDDIRDDLISAAGEGIAKHIAKALAKGVKPNLDTALLVTIARRDMLDWLRANKQHVMTEGQVDNATLDRLNYGTPGDPNFHWPEPDSDPEPSTKVPWEVDPQKLAQGDAIDQVIGKLAMSGMSQGTIAFLLTEPLSGAIWARLQGTAEALEDCTPLCPGGISQQAVAKRMAKLRRL